MVSLFSGIGGLDLGLRQAGHEVLLQVELDARARQCLTVHFREACQQQSVEALLELPADTELLAAGFPCQVRALDGCCKRRWSACLPACSLLFPLGWP